MVQSVVVGDKCSLSNILDFKVTHTDWYIIVDFSSQILTCHAVHKVECIKEGSQVIVLDTRDLNIDTVQIDNKDVEFKLLKEVGELGQPLEISVPVEKNKVGSVFNLSLRYKTSTKATAVQWMPPEQTLGKNHPYMFTQCQAIHARSLLPCQDSPGCKFTYSAEITVPKVMVALMSAVKGDENLLENGKKICFFEQKIPIPSYLLAIAIGALECRSVGPRSKVWCESEMIDACEYEFAKVEDMLKAAESLMGPYVWGVYDLLILPPSFPFGGMENPCLTFVTPTIVAGDRSLTNVVVHEITHSWTGNLVTNRTWEHFWLNEGFTRFIEDKIVGILDGEQMRQFMLIGGWHSLIDSIEVFGATNKLTALTPELNGINPDDAFSSVPYEKGSSFLYYIESLVGGAEVFNPFLKSYIEHFKYKTVVTEDFKKYLLEYFKNNLESLKQIDWNAWLHSPGMPPVNVVDMYDTTLSNDCKNLCEKWVNSSPDQLDFFKEEEFSSLTTMQKVDFLTKLFQEKPLDLSYIQKMSDVYKLFTYGVSEIEFAFLRLCVRAKWSDVYERVVKFLLKQGRMKFVRPLYREMYKYEESKQLAIDTFKTNKHIYHTVTSTMLYKDLHLE